MDGSSRRICPLTSARQSPPVTRSLPAHTTLAEAERLLIRTTLERTGNNKAETARLLGLDVKTIRNKLRSWALDG